jgi:Flp pilus assembly protein TadG
MRFSILPRLRKVRDRDVSPDQRYTVRTTDPEDRGLPNRRIPNAMEVKLEKHCRSCRRNRKGAAVVEMAVVAPVFFLLVFGMIEFGRAIMVEQILTNAAREGARLAVLDSATPVHDTIITKVDTYLRNSGITGATVTVSPNEPTDSSVKNGDPIKVTVTIPFTTVSWTPSPWFLGSQTLKATSVMRRETVQ